MAEAVSGISDWRSQARILALQALCVFDALGEPLPEAELDRFLSDPLTYADLDWPPPSTAAQAGLLQRAHELATGTWRNRQRCDRLLSQNARQWPLERMQPVDRNILRLGLYELLECPDTPYQVVLNEAIELAHLFGSPESPAFVNGVLDGLRRDLTPAEVSPPDVGQVNDLPPEQTTGH